MPYITLRALPNYHQVSFEELLTNSIDLKQFFYNKTPSNTRTHYVQNVNKKLITSINFDDMKKSLYHFIDLNQQFFNGTISSLSTMYDTFYIPKSSGGLRRIDAPNDELMRTLKDLKRLFEDKLLAIHHTCAYAYIPGRCPLDAIKRHQSNESKWFGKFDFNNFFGSTTQEFLESQLKQIFPFSELLNDAQISGLFHQVLSLCFLNNCLPQGTPMSPMLTNIMMIPIDFHISKWLRSLDKHTFVYTRYADDMQISSRSPFNIGKVQNLILDVLNSFHAPFRLNDEKTRYGSTSGSNWNLGLMLNSQNEITIGYKRKKQLKIMLNNFLYDYSNGKFWDASEVRHLQGQLQYYLSIEPDYISYLVDRYSQIHNVKIYDTFCKILKSN